MYGLVFVRLKLLEYGQNIGPIAASRNIYEKRLMSIKQNGGKNRDSGFGVNY